MRTVWVVGHIPPRRLARQCAWCKRWLDAESERLARAGAKTSHGLCGECEAKEFAA